MLIHLSFTNPLTPLLVVAGVLAGLGLLFVIAQELHIRFGLRTTERYRAWRRRTPGNWFFAMLGLWIFATLGCALAYTAVDIVTYRTAVEQVRVAIPGALDVADAERLLGNNHAHLVAAVVPDASGIVGKAVTADGQHLTLRQLSAGTYALSSD